MVRWTRLRIWFRRRRTSVDEVLESYPAQTSRADERISAAPYIAQSGARGSNGSAFCSHTGALRLEDFLSVSHALAGTPRPDIPLERVAQRLDVLPNYSAR
jgi:hypothetical protein